MLVQHRSANSGTRLQEALENAVHRLPTHVTSMHELDRGAIEAVFDLAGELSEADPSAYHRLLEHKVVGVMFYQPSTRTRLNFEAAIARLGGGRIGFSDVKTTRAGDYYQETLEDVVSFTGAIADVLVLRHFETGAAARARAVSPVPLINAGDGYGEHPTQALGDLWTMHRLLGGLDGAAIGLLGDLSIRSLRAITIGLSRFAPSRVLVLPPPGKDVPAEARETLRASRVPWEECADVGEMLARADLVETIGVRHPDHSLPNDRSADASTTPSKYRIDAGAIAAAGRCRHILHPGPRTDEIAVDVDRLPHARYFEQARNGLFVRMALLATAARRGA
jgi:aspartate carbamoyltransferase catalytic subunit